MNEKIINAFTKPVLAAANGVEVSCPHCKKTHRIALKTGVPREQMIATKITPSNAAFSADVVAKHIETTTKILKSVALDAGSRVHVFMHKMMQHDDGSLEFHFLVALNDKATKAKPNKG